MESVFTYLLNIDTLIYFALITMHDYIVEFYYLHLALFCPNCPEPYKMKDFFLLYKQFTFFYYLSENKMLINNSNTITATSNH